MQRLIVLIGFLFVAGCTTQYTGAETEGADRSSTPSPGPDAEELPDTTTPQALHFESCDAQQSWWSELDNWFVDESFLGFSPNGGLVVRSAIHGPGMAVRASGWTVSTSNGALR